MSTCILCRKRFVNFYNVSAQVRKQTTSATRQFTVSALSNFKLSLQSVLKKITFSLCASFAFDLFPIDLIDFFVDEAMACEQFCHRPGSSYSPSPRGMSFSSIQSPRTDSSKFRFLRVPQIPSVPHPLKFSPSGKGKDWFIDRFKNIKKEIKMQFCYNFDAKRFGKKNRIYQITGT